jgi:hypothetical protein
VEGDGMIRQNKGEKRLRLLLSLGLERRRMHVDYATKGPKCKCNPNSYPPWTINLGVFPKDMGVIEKMRRIGVRISSEMG